MAFQGWRAKASQILQQLRKPRYLLGSLVVAGAAAIALPFLVLRGAQDKVAASPEEEPCSMESGGQRVGYIRTILLCSMDSPKCNPDQSQVFRAQAVGGWSTQALMIPDIPDGYVISGGDVFDPSPYRIANVGFGKITITKYANSDDYCTQHYWYYMNANHISSDPEDRIRIKICVYYDKWQGAPTTESCPPPTLDRP
jgi:hypothetical protein